MEKENLPIVDDDIDIYINDYYSVNKEKALKYSKEYYKRPGIKEKRSKYNKEYYRRKRKYVICKKCNIPILEHNFLLHTTSYRHIYGKKFKPEPKECKRVKIVEKPKPPLLDKIEIM
ncbi:MAG: hypothetical protein ACYTBJ_25625 [Planctomycetota bacterium]|jgi:hypothetical protein